MLAVYQNISGGIYGGRLLAVNQNISGGIYGGRLLAVNQNISGGIYGGRLLAVNYVYDFNGKISSENENSNSFVVFYW